MPARPGAGRRLVVVDDDGARRESLAALIEARGWRVETAPDGLAGLAVIRRSPPDGVIADVMMPGLDGLALCRALRAEAATRAIPCVLMSGFIAGGEDRELAFRAGAAALVTPGAGGAGAMLDELLSALERPVEAAGDLPTEAEIGRAYTDRLYHEVLASGATNRSLGRTVAVLEAEVAVLARLADAAQRRAGITALVQDLLEQGFAQAGIACGAVYLREGDGSFTLIGAMRGAQECDLPDPAGDRDLLTSVACDRRVVAMPDGARPGLVLAPVRWAEEPLGVLAIEPPPADDPARRREFAGAVAGQFARTVSHLRALESLTTAESRLREIAAHIEDVFWVVDAGLSRILYISPGFDRLWGRPAAALGGEMSAALSSVHPEDLDAVLASLRTFDGRVVEERRQYRIVRPDRSIRWIESRAFPVEDGTGRVARICGVARDVTDRRLRELRDGTLRALREALAPAADPPAALAAAAEVIRAALGWPLAMAWTADESTGTARCLGASGPGAATAAEFVEVSRATVFASGDGLPGSVLASAAGRWVGDADTAEWLVRREAAGRSGLRTIVGVPVPVDGTVIGILECATATRSPRDADLLAILEEAGREAGLHLGRMRARAALARAEEHLQRAQKLESLGRLAGGIAHDFNNLLTPILGYGELLLSEGRLGTSERARVEAMRLAAERAAGLTRELLGFSRKRVSQLAPLDADGAVAEVATLLGRTLGELVDLRVSAGTLGARILADRGQMTQIVMNLAVNASDAMPRGGRLEIATAVEDVHEERSGAVEVIPPGRYVVLGVRDEGSGMDAGTLARIFDPFFTTKGEGRGTGLGLAMVWSIVKGYAGFVDVRTQPGRGTEFRLYFPKLAGEPASRAADPVVFHVRPAGRPRTLPDPDPGLTAV